MKKEVAAGLFFAGVLAIVLVTRLGPAELTDEQKAEIKRKHRAY